MDSVRDHQPLLKAVLRAAEATAGPLGQRAYEQWRRDQDPSAPGSAQLCWEFGGWPGVLRAAGLPCGEYTDDELLDAVRRFASETDPPWGIRKYRMWRALMDPLPPDEGTITRRFQGWRRAMATAGLPQPSQTDEQLVLNTLRRFVNETSPPWSLTSYRTWRLQITPLPPTDANVIRGAGVTRWRDAVARVAPFDDEA